jgi:hypothetical protein
VRKEIFAAKREEVTGSRRKSRNEELHNSCSSLNIIKVIKPRRMRWAGCAASMEEMRHL